MGKMFDIAYYIVSHVTDSSSDQGQMIGGQERRDDWPIVPGSSPRIFAGRFFSDVSLLPQRTLAPAAKRAWGRVATKTIASHPLASHNAFEETSTRDAVVRANERPRRESASRIKGVDRRESDRIELRAVETRPGREWTSCLEKKTYNESV